MRQTRTGVYDLWRPDGTPVPAVFDSPHSGTDYPDDFGHSVPMARLRRAEDMHVDDLFSAAPDRGATFLAARFPRSYVDPNRAADDIDPKLIDGIWPDPVSVSDKSRLGHGLIWRLCPPDVAIYDRKLEVAEVRRRIDRFHQPYHAALADELGRLYGRFGRVFHVNCHSMPAASAPLVIDRAGARRRADFVLDDRDGTSCSPTFRILVQETLQDMGYAVAINDPYKGVELVRAHADPAAGRHSLQIEISRALYMDEDSFARSANYDRLKSDIDRLVAILCEHAAGRREAEAAE